MRKPRTAQGVTFPYAFTKNGRTGKIYRLGSGKFKTYFMFGQEPDHNTHGTFDTALLYLEREFATLDTNRANSLSQNPLRSDVQGYAELEQLLIERGNGASLRDAVNFFLAHSKNRRFEPKTVSDCVAAHLKHQEGNGVTSIQIKTLAKHFRRFERDFGSRKIHEVTTLEVANWLAGCTDRDTGKPWSAKTRKSVRGSLVSLSLFAQDSLKAIPSIGKTEFQLVKNPKAGAKAPVEIYMPDELQKLLLKALETDIDLIPALIVGNLLGLRPYEFHAEGLNRTPLTWEEFNWHDKRLHISKQKVRSKSARDIPIQAATEAWLEPFKRLSGPMWSYQKAYEDKMNTLRRKAGVTGKHDGYRHSYASYRVRQIKQDMAQVAYEMGNSPKELQDSYKRNVTDQQAEEWFSLMPPSGYSEKIKTALALREAA